MANDTPVTMAPPTDAVPSVLQVDAEQVLPNADGTFTVKSKHMLPLLAAGWQIVVASGTTHVP